MMHEGYIALMACILTDKSPEAAFRDMYREVAVPEARTGRPVGPVSPDTIKMAQMRKTMTYKQVGKEFGITEGAVCRRIQRYNRMKEEGLA